MFREKLTESAQNAIHACHCIVTLAINTEKSRLMWISTVKRFVQSSYFACRKNNLFWRTSYEHTYMCKTRYHNKLRAFSNSVSKTFLVPYIAFRIGKPSSFFDAMGRCKHSQNINTLSNLNVALLNRVFTVFEINV